MERDKHKKLSDMGDLSLAAIFVAALIIALLRPIVFGPTGLAEFILVAAAIATIFSLAGISAPAKRGVLHIIIGILGACVLYLVFQGTLTNPSGNSLAGLLGIANWTAISTILVPATLKYLFSGVKMLFFGVLEPMK